LTGVGSSERAKYLCAGAMDRQARRELNVCLATWQALNRGVEAYIVESDGGARWTREA
jgi:hypothetical protein